MRASQLRVLAWTFAALLPPPSDDDDDDDNKNEENDYYAILGVEKDAEQSQIRRAYKKKSLQLHPDKIAQRSARSRTGEGSAEPSENDVKGQFQRMKGAYETLSDPQKRDVYDALGERGIKILSDPGAAMDPHNLLENLSHSSVLDRTKILTLLILGLGLVTVQPILICVKVDQTLPGGNGGLLNNASWGAIFVPLWAFDLAIAIGLAVLNREGIRRIAEMAFRVRQRLRRGRGGQGEVTGGDGVGDGGGESTAGGTADSGTKPGGGGSGGEGKEAAGDRVPTWRYLWPTLKHFCLIVLQILLVLKWDGVLLPPSSWTYVLVLCPLYAYEVLRLAESALDVMHLHDSVGRMVTVRYLERRVLPEELGTLMGEGEREGGGGDVDEEAGGVGGAINTIASSRSYADLTEEERDAINSRYIIVHTSPLDEDDEDSRREGGGSENDENDDDDDNTLAEEEDLEAVASSPEYRAAMKSLFQSLRTARDVLLFHLPFLVLLVIKLDGDGSGGDNGGRGENWSWWLVFSPLWVMICLDWSRHCLGCCCGAVRGVGEGAEVLVHLDDLDVDEDEDLEERDEERRDDRDDVAEEGKESDPLVPPRPVADAVAATTTPTTAIPVKRTPSQSEEEKDEHDDARADSSTPTKLSEKEEEEEEENDRKEDALPLHSPVPVPEIGNDNDASGVGQIKDNGNGGGAGVSPPPVFIDQDKYETWQEGAEEEEEEGEGMGMETGPDANATAEAAAHGISCLWQTLWALHLGLFLGKLSLERPPVDGGEYDGDDDEDGEGSGGGGYSALWIAFPLLLACGLLLCCCCLSVYCASSGGDDDVNEEGDDGEEKKDLGDDEGSHQDGGSGGGGGGGTIVSTLQENDDDADSAVLLAQNSSCSDEHVRESLDEALVASGLASSASASILSSLSAGLPSVAENDGEEEEDEGFSPLMLTVVPLGKGDDGEDDAAKGVMAEDAIAVSRTGTVSSKSSNSVEKGPNDDTGAGAVVTTVFSDMDDLD